MSEPDYTSPSDRSAEANNLLAGQIGDAILIDVHNPLWLDDMSLPEPDLALIRHKDFTDTFPTPADVFLVIEVADSSLTYDRDVKFPRYAAAGIPEAWLVNLNANVIERYSDARDARYHQIFVAGIEDTLSSTVLPDLAIPVATVLGSTEQG